MTAVPGLLAWLDGRLAAIVEGNPRLALDKGVLAVADELRTRRITDIEQAGSACSAIALLHYCRALALKGNEAHAEMARAASLYATIAQIRPELVPPELLPLIEQGDEPRADAVSRLREHAINSKDAVALSLAAALVWDLVSRPDGARLEDLASLAEIHWARAQLVSDIHDLDEAVEVGLAWLEGAPESHGERAFRLWRLGLAEFVRSLRLSDSARLDQAITYYSAALASAADDDAKRHSYASDLAIGLNQRATATNRIEDIDAAVAGWKTALETAPPGHTDRGAHHANIGTMLWSKFQMAGETTALDNAISSWSAARSTTSRRDTASTAPWPHCWRRPCCSGPTATVRSATPTSPSAC